MYCDLSIEVDIAIGTDYSKAEKNMIIFIVQIYETFNLYLFISCSLRNNGNYRQNKTKNYERRRNIADKRIKEHKSKNMALYTRNTKYIFMQTAKQSNAQV